VKRSKKNHYNIYEYKYKYNLFFNKKKSLSKFNKFLLHQFKNCEVTNVHTTSSRFKNYFLGVTFGIMNSYIIINLNFFHRCMS
jgi:hypothetical protein